MTSSSGGRRADSSPRARASVLAAAAGLLLCLAFSGCTSGQGAPTTPTQEQSPPSDPGAPSEPEDGGPTSDDSTATGAPDSEADPDGTGASESEGEAGGEDEGGSDSVVNATDDWREPEDPTLEGPTVAPVLPEVDGRIGNDVVLPTEVTVSVPSIATATLTAETPGEYAGPAVIVDVQITNESDAPQPVGSAVVALTAEDGEVGVPTWASPNNPFQGEVPAGATVDGTYVFMMDPAGERPVTVRVNYAAGEPVATFTGTTP